MQRSCGAPFQLNAENGGNSIAPSRISMARTGVGFHCSHEQLSPSALLRIARLAADAGFTHAMCSDHFHPWSERQGHSGFAWSWLGSALEATTMSFGTVCAPGQRYHPAIVAQATATLSEMYPGRFWLAIGSGEALNEAITGDEWPAKPHRDRRLEESADVMRQLWTGATVSLKSHVRVVRARLYSRPAAAPPLFGAALTPETARRVGRWADGLITVPGPPHAMRATVEAFREGGGVGKPLYLQVALSFAPSQEAAVRAAHDQWRHAALPPSMLADLSSPGDFDQRTADASVLDVLSRVRTSSQIERHVEWLQADCTLGFDRIYLHNVARDHQAAFLDACGTHLIPAMADMPVARPN
jgi:probable non-F420 flavinoid oxidoreductase